jgi:hypothetical protein
MIIAACILLAGVVVELWAISRAPYGYQDEDGFHPGIERRRR